MATRLETFDLQSWSLRRRDTVISALASYDIGDPSGTVIGRAEEVCEWRWLRALKVTRLRAVTPLRMRVEITHPSGFFLIERDWDWQGTKPIRACLSNGTLLVRLRRTRKFFGVLFGETVIERPDCSQIGTIVTLQPIVLWGLRYELRDLQQRPVARWQWFVESRWSPPRRCAVALEPGVPSDPWSLVALVASLDTALRVARR
jgi:hypothetical protein